MKNIRPNITVENCKDVLEFYHSTFGGEIKNLQMADGKDMFKGHEGKIVHAELHINNNCVIYLNDDLGSNKQMGSNIQLVLEMDSKEEIERVYKALSEKGSVQYELQKTFWGAYHAVLADRFGILWGLNFSER